MAKIVPSAADIVPRMLLESISIEDPERGAMRLGVAKKRDDGDAAAEAAATTETSPAKEGTP
jgi:hypothetical protein